MATRNSKKPAFQIGDKVRLMHGNSAETLTVCWISKGDQTRGEQLIATERNGHSHTTSPAVVYELAS